MNRQGRQARVVVSEFQTREDGETPVIEGYFAVFNSIYQIAPGMSESITSGAFTDTISGDVRALVNHNTSLVLGRTKAGTLTLRQDERGLWGHISINKNDIDAMNLYERVKRGDVDQCSFGFDILSEDTNVKEDGSVHWTIKAVELYEVSVCTFPAYQETSVSARTRDAELARSRANERWKSDMIQRLKGGKETC